jgi:elongation factor Ts
MAYTNVEQLKELRRRSEAGVGACREALEATGHDLERAVEYLRKQAIARAEQRAAREVGEGLVGNYVHHDGKLAALVEVNCETDFVARTEAFHRLVKQLAEHIAAAAPQFVDRVAVPAAVVEARRAEFAALGAGKREDVRAKIVAGKLEGYYRDVVLLEQAWIREPDTTIGDLINQTAATLGERIRVRRFARLCVGEA